MIRLNIYKNVNVFLMMKNRIVALYVTHKLSKSIPYKYCFIPTDNYYYYLIIISP